MRLHFLRGNATSLVLPLVLVRLLLMADADAEIARPPSLPPAAAKRPAAARPKKEERRAEVARRVAEEGEELKLIKTATHAPNADNKSWTQTTYAEGAMWSGWRNPTVPVNPNCAIAPGLPSLFNTGPNKYGLPNHDSLYNGPNSILSTDEKKAVREEQTRVKELGVLEKALHYMEKQRGLLVKQIGVWIGRREHAFCLDLAIECSDEQRDAIQERIKKYLPASVADWFTKENILCCLFHEVPLETEILEQNDQWAAFLKLQQTYTNMIDCLGYAKPAWHERRPNIFAELAPLSADEADDEEDENYPRVSDARRALAAFSTVRPPPPHGPPAPRRSSLTVRPPPRLRLC